MPSKKKVTKKTKIIKRKPQKQTPIPPEIDKLQKSMDTKKLQATGNSKVFTRVQLRDIYRLCLAGYTDKELAELYCISIDRWRDLTNTSSPEHVPELTEALYKGRDGATAQVARSLYKRANGWSHPATKFFMDPDGNIVSQDYTERYPGDVRAQEIILKNRRPNDWKDKQEVRHTGDNIAPQVNIITDEETVKRLMNLQNEDNKPATTEDDDA